jgi:N12 class adenine-specific DNA methylase
LKEGLRERLESLSTRKDDLLTISEIGIDQIIVDEAQEFRKLSFATNMSTLKGVDPNGSQRAWDLYVKSRFVGTKNPGRALVLASGTPITNTLGEMFSVQRYLGYAALSERGLHEFDAWAGLDLRRRLHRTRAPALWQVQAGHALRHLRQRAGVDRHVPLLRGRGDAGRPA